MRLYLEQRPDLVVLDLMLPLMHGLEVCRAIRRTSRVPIVMLTALADEGDRVAGLELGADDYITKPFSSREVVARVKALLRRRVFDDGADQVISLPGLRIDLSQHRVEAGGAHVALTPTEFRLLWCLASQPGQVLSQCKLASQALRWSRGVDAGIIALHIQRLRKKLGSRGQLFSITTVRGLGYRFDSGAAAGQGDEVGGSSSSRGGNSCQRPSSKCSRTCPALSNLLCMLEERSAPTTRSG